MVMEVLQPRQCWVWGWELPHALLSPFSIFAMRGPWCAPVAQPCCQRRAALPQEGWDLDAIRFNAGPILFPLGCPDDPPILL